MNWFCQNIHAIFTAIGLVLDIIGVVMLFVLSSIPYKEIEGINLRHHSSKAHDAYLATEEIKNQLNRMISDINKENEDKAKKAKFWLKFIVLGFVFQFVSIFF